MNIIALLDEMRQHGGEAITTGLADDVILCFADIDTRLVQAITAASAEYQRLKEDEKEVLALDERGQQKAIQSGFINFYSDDTINPYVSLAARGPWLVTLKGAVLHDSGGYGMLGFGHAPEAILQAMNQQQVMANVMTPNISQLKLDRALRAEIGHSRDGCPFQRFLCLNSGSEAVTLAARICDVNSKLMTDPGGRYANHPIKRVGLTGAFHGRTDRPARFSDSTRETYSRHLASFRDNDSLITVEPNNIQQLRQVFNWANSHQIFIEGMFLEPVMGEGNPGKSVSPEFYAAARALTSKHGALLLVDSIQAGMRAHGVLSLFDYPGFEDLEAPDMEAYSKALNAGQFPLSVLALNARAAGLYRKGIYGNTMTTNPRAMDVACAVLASFTEDIRRNVVEKGAECLTRLQQLQKELGGAIVNVQGTGLLFSIELDGSRYRSHGANSTEEYMRIHGINVIHGGKNSLRYTPHFEISSEEIDLIVYATRVALLHGPAKAVGDNAQAA